MQQLPGGMIRSIYADYFFFGVFVDHVEVHLPTERGITQYVEMLNFRFDVGPRLPGGPRAVGLVGLLQYFGRQHALPRRFRRLDRHGRNGADAPDADVTMRYVGWLWNNAGERPAVSQGLD